MTEKDQAVANERFRALCAAHLFLLRGDDVLLLRRANTGYADGSYSVIAGHLDGDEEVVAAIIREAREEAGITLAAEDARVVGVMHRKSNDERIDFFLIARRWRGDVINAEPGKCDELLWRPLDALPENVIPYVRRALTLTVQVDDQRRGVSGVWFESFGWDA
jgi:8-oxo-dGTP diphosphatase